LAALEDTKHVKLAQEFNEAGKEYFYEQLRQIGIDFVPTEANFVYLPLRNAHVLYEKLLKYGVIVRPIGTEGLRITIGLPEENRRFIESFKKIIHS
jgi:histidinol-phosphate aminotransferase